MVEYMKDQPSFCKPTYMKPRIAAVGSPLVPARPPTRISNQLRLRPRVTARGPTTAGYETMHRTLDAEPHDSDVAQRRRKQCKQNIEAQHIPERRTPTIPEEHVEPAIHMEMDYLVDGSRAAPRGAVLKSGTRAAADSSSESCGWGLLLRRNRPIDLKVGLCTGGGFAQYLPPFDSDSVS